MKSILKLPLILITLMLFEIACQPGARSPAAPTNGLRLPKTVKEAVLVNFRPLTDTGRSIGAVWSPDGQTLAYTQLSFAPQLASYHTSNTQPKTEVWVASVNGKNGHFVDLGMALFYGKDGSEIFYQVYDPSDNTPSVYAINPATQKTRHFLGTQGFPNVYDLADGRLVLSEVGTYAPLRIFNPANGERQALMVEHPSNSPQNARLSPDGKRLAYTKLKAIYLSNPDGSSPKLVSDYGNGPAKVWWSPNSQLLAYSTGISEIDRLVLADRQGKTRVVLFPVLAESGTVSSIAWSPDNRWLLVTTESIEAYARPTRLYYFDIKGEHQILLESFLSASPAWSPDGHTLALSIWISPQSEEPVFDIWLADLTDVKTAANLPKTSPPAPKPTPTLAEISPGLPPDQVVYRFWDRINQKDYHSAWSLLSEPGRIVQKYPDFIAFYECIQQVSITDLQEFQGDENTQIFSTKIHYRKDPDCNELWKQSNDFYAILIKDASTNPWQIECFSNTTSCINQGP